MDNNSDSNNNFWSPSIGDVALVKYALEKAVPKKKKIGKLLDVDIPSIEQGMCGDAILYIRVLAYCTRLLVQRKMKISKLSPTEREEIEKLMNGTVGNIGAYKETILSLGRMPNLPSKKKQFRHFQHKSIKNSEPWEWYNNHVTYQRAGFNSDFEYGITDT